MAVWRLLSLHLSAAGVISTCCTWRTSNTLITVGSKTSGGQIRKRSVTTTAKISLQKMLENFYSWRKLKGHEKDCKQTDLVKTAMSQLGETGQFKNLKCAQKVPLLSTQTLSFWPGKYRHANPIQNNHTWVHVIVNTGRNIRGNPDLHESYTNRYQKHEPNGFGC
jgi:hypothetical protein